MDAEHGFSILGELYQANTVAIDDPTENYHEASKITRHGSCKDYFGVVILENSPHLQRRAATPIKRFFVDDVIPLPRPAMPRHSFKSLAIGRRSKRNFLKAPIRLDKLATILFFAHGAHPAPGNHTTNRRRMVPSGGGLCPIDLFVFALHVTGLKPGLYYYDPLAHSLQLVQAGDFAATIEDSLLHDETSTNVAAVLVCAGVFWRSRFKYGPRAYRFVLLEAGHMIQNALLAAGGLNIAATPVGGFYDDILNEAIGLDGVTESTLYLTCLGQAT